MTPPRPVFAVVVPLLDGAAYLGETLASLFEQTGDFDLRVHVQDGGSSDDGPAIVRDWIERLEAAPPDHGARELTFASEPDAGLYDAVNRGFACLAAADDAWLTWLGADDLLARGALAIVGEIAATYPDIRWLGGRKAQVDESGLMRSPGEFMPADRASLAAGLHDSRALPFLMQEGVFWKAGLWREVGGLDASYRLAGDWDLWRRMARIETYHAVDAFLALHRRRAGQLSDDLAPYYAELDAALAQDRAAYDDRLDVVLNGRGADASSRPRNAPAPVIWRNAVQGAWRRVQMNVEAPPPPALISPAHAGRPVALRWVSGVRFRPQPSRDRVMPPGHFELSGEIFAEINLPRGGGWSLKGSLRFQGAARWLDVELDGAPLMERIELRSTGSGRDYDLDVPFTAQPGVHTVRLRLSPAADDPDRTCRLATRGLHVVKRAPRTPPPVV
ncbi:glycosyltransferase [Brevundimonas sp.]|uniref:glycosyltransferase n=1 Tax=Brevundimonas sp. TaxID=1871086 RepID=UPI0025D14AC4|nr:glycosyltransferase [Brevundimonas sp.]